MTPDAIRLFLLVYDHAAGELVCCYDIPDAEEAVALYELFEAGYNGRAGIEVVLIGSDSLATVKRTHANYFPPTATSPHLAGL